MSADPTLFAHDASAPTVGASCAACGKPGRYPSDHCPSCVAAAVRAQQLPLSPPLNVDESGEPLRHHPDCDGWRMHHAVRSDRGHGMYVAYCGLPECGWCDPPVGMFGRGHTMPTHEAADPCAGQCHEWWNEP